MKLTHRSRVAAALIALLSMLFMQLAVAAYACPELKAVTMTDTMQSEQASMPGCHGMDNKQPNLCYAHADVGNQSLNKPELPQVQPFAAVDLVLTLVMTDVAYRQASILIKPGHIPHASAPPLAIRNCCFRL